MTRRLLPHTLMVTFLNDALSSRRITLDHLADLLAPIPEAVVRSWIDGSGRPSPDDLLPLASALRVHPVEMVAGWMIDQAPDIEDSVRRVALDPTGSRFPRVSDLALRHPRPRGRMDVGDPHDEARGQRTLTSLDIGTVRKRASGAC